MHAKFWRLAWWMLDGFERWARKRYGDEVYYSMVNALALAATVLLGLLNNDRDNRK